MFKFLLRIILFCLLIILELLKKVSVLVIKYTWSGLKSCWHQSLAYLKSIEDFNKKNSDNDIQIVKVKSKPYKLCI